MFTNPKASQTKVSQFAPHDLSNRFSFHPATTPELQDQHQRVRDLHLTLAEEMAELVPPSRELSLVITKLEEAMFWANAGVARSVPTPTQSESK
jgi:hypothetical protein